MKATVYTKRTGRHLNNNYYLINCVCECVRVCYVAPKQYRRQCQDTIDVVTKIHSCDFKMIHLNYAVLVYL